MITPGPGPPLLDNARDIRAKVGDMIVPVGADPWQHNNVRRGHLKDLLLPVGAETPPVGPPFSNFLQHPSERSLRCTDFVIDTSVVEAAMGETTQSEPYLDEEASEAELEGSANIEDE